VITVEQLKPRVSDILPASESAQSEDASVEIPQQLFGDGPLTDEETIHTVKQWVAKDEEVELSERRTVEEMIENLQAAATARGSKSRLPDLQRSSQRMHRMQRTEMRIQSLSRKKYRRIQSSWFR
jgi:hypothetical protein